VGAAEFKANFEAGDIDAVIADLAPDFGFLHAFSADAATGAERVRGMLTKARATFGDSFHFIDHARGEHMHALPWTATIDGIEADGVDLVKEDEEGRLLEVRFFIRPAEAAQAWGRAMSGGKGPPGG
jgi:hypothetical protein